MDLFRDNEEQSMLKQMQRPISNSDKSGHSAEPEFSPTSSSVYYDPDVHNPDITYEVTAM